MANPEPSLYERKLIAEIGRSRTLLDQLERLAREQRATPEIVVISAARALANYIEVRRPSLRAAVGHAATALTCEIETARKKLNAWIAHLQATLHGVTSLAS
jgi:hypothetical protein